MQIAINGRTYPASAHETVLDVARRNGIYIPTLCYHPRTGQAAKCRACVAKIEGMKGLQTTCTTKVRDGMVVTTDSEEVLESQRMVIELMLASGRHDCLSCPACGSCELQDAAYRLGIEHPGSSSGEGVEVDDSSEFIGVDRNKCISCGRCVAGDNNTVVNESMGMAYRGKETKVVFDNDIPMGSSSCVQCGECVQLCPVGALYDKRAKGQGRSWELAKVETLCPYCGVGCRIELHIDRARNRIVRVTGVEDGPANEGMLCVKGRYGFDFISSPERLTDPLVKNKKGRFEKVSWTQAFSIIAERLKGIKKKHGPDAIGGLASAKVTNEENFAFQKFMRKEVGTNNVDHCARL